MGSLRVNKISANNRTSILWQKQGDQGSAWNQAYVDLVNSDANTKVSEFLFCIVLVPFRLSISNIFKSVINCVYFTTYTCSLSKDIYATHFGFFFSMKIHVPMKEVQFKSMISKIFLVTQYQFFPWKISQEQKQLVFLWKYIMENVDIFSVVNINNCTWQLHTHT